MPTRNKAQSLPAAVREWLEKSLIEGNFSGYEVLAQTLKDKGYDISKSSIHRFGSEFEARLQSLRLSQQMARAVVDANPDDEGAMNEALIRLTQDKMMGLLVEMNVDPEDMDFVKLAKAIAEVAKGSVAQKKFAADYKAKLTAALNKAETGADGKAIAKMSPDEAYRAGLKRVREEAYGLFDDKP